MRSTMSSMDSWRRVILSREQVDARILLKFTVAIQHQGSSVVLKRCTLCHGLAFWSLLILGVYSPVTSSQTTAFSHVTWARTMFFLVFFHTGLHSSRVLFALVVVALCHRHLCSFPFRTVVVRGQLICLVGHFLVAFEHKA